MPNLLNGMDNARREPRRVAELEARTPEESQPESDADILRELGWWLGTVNGDEPEVQDK